METVTDIHSRTKYREQATYGVQPELAHLQCRSYV